MDSPRPLAFITGGARRVGRAIALNLAEAGFDIAFTYHTSGGDAQELIEILKPHGREVLAIRIDLSIPDEAIAAITQQLADRAERMTVLVNNASAFTPATLKQTNSDLMTRLFNLHMQTPVLLCKTFAGVLGYNGGHVVNMLDLLVDRPMPAYLAYCASKAAMANATLTLARELAPRVTVNGIAPGVIDWPDDYPADERAAYLRRVPLARAGTPDDAAKLVRFLVTQAPYITGQIIHLDGGRSLT